MRVVTGECLDRLVEGAKGVDPLGQTDTELKGQILVERLDGLQRVGITSGPDQGHLVEPFSIRGEDDSVLTAEKESQGKFPLQVPDVGADHLVGEV